MPFKEIAFARIKTEQADKYKPLVPLTDGLRQCLDQMDWPTRGQQKLRATFLNIESMSVFNKGLIVRELKSGEVWEVEVLHSTSTAPSFIFGNGNFAQHKNYFNYSYERNLFYSWPAPLFETFGYKPVLRPSSRSPGSNSTLNTTPTSSRASRFSSTPTPSRATCK